MGHSCRAFCSATGSDGPSRWRAIAGWRGRSDFGTIFGDLLPGNTCRLEPPEGQDITDGLEIKVNLGGVWKQSLTELSGGQRCGRLQQGGCGAMPTRY